MLESCCLLVTEQPYTRENCKVHLPRVSTPKERPHNPFLWGGPKLGVLQTANPYSSSSWSSRGLALEWILNEVDNRTLSFVPR